MLKPPSSIQIPEWVYRTAPILVFLAFAIGIAVVVLNIPDGDPPPPITVTDSDSSIIASHKITEIEAVSVIEKSKFDSLQNSSNVKIKNHEREIERLKKLSDNNWSLSGDSSYNLSISRISQEPEYRKRFVYN